MTTMLVELDHTAGHCTCCGLPIMWSRYRSTDGHFLTDDGRGWAFCWCERRTFAGLLVNKPLSWVADPWIPLWVGL